MNKIELVLGDLVADDSDAIVNAANSSLRWGSGVDGAIRKAAGPTLFDECVKIRETTHPNGLDTGEAVHTSGGNLKCKYVIHTVGPIWGVSEIPIIDLENAYKSCFSIGDKLNIKSIAFPAISAGAFGYPLNEAAEIAIRTCSNVNTKIERIRIVLFTQDVFNVFSQILK